MGGMRGTHGREEKCMQASDMKYLERGDYLKEIGIYCRIKYNTSFRDRINLIQYMKEWVAFVNTVLKLRVP
jgi:hypothetical protein